MNNRDDQRGQLPDLSGRCVLVGICGGVAAYKSATLISRLVQAGAEVRVAMTEAAVQFLGPATLAALTGSAPVNSVFDQRFPLGTHIELVDGVELFAVAPATANFLGKTANGLADDLLSTLYLTHGGPVLMAPAMNGEMWEKPAVQRNVATLKADGVQIIGPSEGWLSCRRRGPGRMVEPETLLDAVVSHLQGLPAESG